MQSGQMSEAPKCIGDFGRIDHPQDVKSGVLSYFVTLHCLLVYRIIGAGSMFTPLAVLLLVCQGELNSSVSRSMVERHGGPVTKQFICLSQSLHFAFSLRRKSSIMQLLSCICNCSTMIGSGTATAVTSVVTILKVVAVSRVFTVSRVVTVSRV